MKVETRKVVILEEVDKEQIKKLIKMLSDRFGANKEAIDAISETLEYLEFLYKSFG